MTSNVLIGSRALAYWSKSFKPSNDADWDIISEAPIEGAEWHNPEHLNNNEVQRWTTPQYSIEFAGEMVYVALPSVLAAIKRSHLWRDLSFQKHITMYHRHLAGSISVHLNSFLEERTRLTHEAYPQGNPNLMQTKEEFFDDAVKKKYDHDHLHELVAYYDKPLYTRLQPDSALAWCSKDLWYNLMHEDKIKCIAEEAHVIAMERMMIPNEWEYPAKKAYIKAVDKVCTTLCSGWFRDYAIDHYPEVMRHFSQSKFNHVKKELT